jgi:hypothetical protein
MPRFTVSHHTGSKEGDHYDLMLEVGEALRTWRLRTPAFAAPQTARAIPDHRKTYLDYEGEVSGGRGRVRIWDTGLYTADEWTPSRVQVGLVGRQLRTRLLLTQAPQTPGGKETGWTAVDPAHDLRKAAAAFLRGDPLEGAPSPELAQLRTALTHEEQKIMAVVDQYARGGTVEWSLAEIDPGLRQQLDRERARWQHPWLAGAKEYADRLSNLIGLLRKHRTPAAP